MSKIKVNTIAPRSGTTVTLGEAGDTIALGACASQTGFGRTGTVDWCTTVKTSPLTAVSGKGYFVNTCGGAITVTLPSSPSAGDIVALKDYAGKWATACKAVTLGRGGSKINGVCEDATLNTKDQSVTMVYVDGTKGWQDVHDSTANITGAGYITASGGTVATCGNYKTHTFTSDGCFQVTALANCSAYNAVSYLVVAGGGGGGANHGGAGGAGGFREGKSPAVAPYTASPLVAPAGITVTASTYPITVGGGGGKAGCAPTLAGGTGSNSVFSTITSAGGGGGGGSNTNGVTGGSGGGAGGEGTASKGPGNNPPVSPPQGSDGGCRSTPSRAPSGGGGGATAVGVDSPGNMAGGAGAGTAIHFNPTPAPAGTPGPSPSLRYFAGGGGGAAYPPQTGSLGQPNNGDGGVGGGGDGNGGNPSPVSAANCAGSGTANTGGGAGGAYCGPTRAGAGGSGIVIIQYRYQ